MTYFRNHLAVYRMSMERRYRKIRNLLWVGEFWLTLVSVVAATLLLLTVGCAKPVMTPCPEPPVIQRPALAIHQLKPDSSSSEVIKAYVLDLAKMTGYSNQLEALLEAYRKPKADAPSAKEVR